MKKQAGFGQGGIAPQTIVLAVVEQARARVGRLDSKTNKEAIADIEAHCLWVESVQQSLREHGFAEQADRLTPRASRTVNAGKERQHTDLDLIVNLLLSL